MFITAALDLLKYFRVPDIILRHGSGPARHMESHWLSRDAQQSLEVAQHGPLQFSVAEGKHPLPARPAEIAHWREVEGADDNRYGDDDELLSIGAPLGLE